MPLKNLIIFSLQGKATEFSKSIAQLQSRSDHNGTVTGKLLGIAAANESNIDVKLLDLGSVIFHKISIIHSVQYLGIFHSSRTKFRAHLIGVALDESSNGQIWVTVGERLLETFITVRQAINHKCETLLMLRELNQQAITQAITWWRGSKCDFRPATVE